MEALLAGLLRRRDHWLRYLRAADQRSALEATLADIRREAVDRAAAALEATGHSGPGGAGAVAAGDWIAFANELLTKKGEWRKGPALAKTLAGDDEALEALRALQALPPARYEDRQWEALGALVRVATVAVAQLKATFAAHGQADFVEIAQGALRALGTEDDPTDLLLALDYRIHHLLVDEFQDTSRLAERAAREAHRGLGAGRRPHALRRGRPHAVDLPLPRGRGGPLPARAARGHRRRAPSCRSRSRPTSARRRASWTG